MKPPSCFKFYAWNFDRSHRQPSELGHWVKPWQWRPCQAGQKRKVQQRRETPSVNMFCWWYLHSLLDEEIYWQTVVSCPLIFLTSRNHLHVGYFLTFLGDLDSENQPKLQKFQWDVTLGPLLTFLDCLWTACSIQARSTAGVLGAPRLSGVNVPMSRSRVMKMTSLGVIGLNHLQSSQK